MREMSNNMLATRPIQCVCINKMCHNAHRRVSEGKSNYAARARENVNTSAINFARSEFFYENKLE